MKRQAGDTAGPLAIEGVPDGVPVPVSVTITPSGTQDVNLIEVGGAAIALGQATMVASLPVAIASNQSAVPVSGTVAATQGTSPWVVGQGTATNLKTQAEAYQGGTAVGAGNPLQVSLANTGVNATPVAVSLASAPTTSVTQGTTPWIVAGQGTAGSAAAAVTTVQGIASMTPVQVSQATASNLNAQAVGDVASGSSDGGNPLKIGGKAASAAPSAVTAGQRVNALYDLWGREHVRTGQQAPVASTFTQIHVPSTNVQATKTQSSAGGSKRNVCTGFTVTLTAGASPITAAAPLIVSVIDGSSGGTTYLWRSYINIPATAGAIASIVRSGMWLVGSQATAMTVEFSAAGGTNSYESVAFDGVIVEE